nr:unnamed protein product [Callosobruchus analis]
MPFQGKITPNNFNLSFIRETLCCCFILLLSTTPQVITDTSLNAYLMMETDQQLALCRCKEMNERAERDADAHLTSSLRDDERQVLSVKCIVLLMTGMQKVHFQRIIKTISLRSILSETGVRSHMSISHDIRPESHYEHPTRRHARTRHPIQTCLIGVLPMVGVNTPSDAARTVFSKMTDEQLIELVKRYPVLYDMNLAVYRDHTVRNNAWEEIAEQMNTHVEDIKINGEN